MIWFGEEAEALLKQLEKLFKRIVVRIVAFQNDWDRCDPIWRFCWQNRRGRWYETQISYYNGVYFVVNWGESRYREPLCDIEGICKVEAAANAASARA